MQIWKNTGFLYLAVGIGCPGLCFAAGGMLGCRNFWGGQCKSEQTVNF